MMKNGKESEIEWHLQGIIRALFPTIHRKKPERISGYHFWLLLNS